MLLFSSGIFNCMLDLIAMLIFDWKQSLIWNIFCLYISTFLYSGYICDFWKSACVRKRNKPQTENFINKMFFLIWGLISISSSHSCKWIYQIISKPNAKVTRCRVLQHLLFWMLDIFGLLPLLWKQLNRLHS